VLGECVQAKPTRTLGKKSKEAAEAKFPSLFLLFLVFLPAGKFGLNITCDFFPSRLALSFSLSRMKTSRPRRTKKNKKKTRQDDKTRQDKVSEELLYD